MLDFVKFFLRTKIRHWSMFCPTFFSLFFFKLTYVALIPSTCSPLMMSSLLESGSSSGWFFSKSQPVVCRRSRDSYRRKKKHKGFSWWESAQPKMAVNKDGTQPRKRDPIKKERPNQQRGTQSKKRDPTNKEGPNQERGSQPTKRDPIKKEGPNQQPINFQLSSEEGGACWFCWSVPTERTI